MTTIELDYLPQPRQRLLHTTPARQILYGGAAGGGKSHSMRWDAVTFCLQNPGLDAYLFRRTLKELEGTHINRVKRDLPPELGRYNETKSRFEFKNGSLLNFCYCERESDVERYLSEEFHWLGLDEAAKFTEMQILMLRTRLRLGSFEPMPSQKHLLPRMVLASNPGGPAHSFLKMTFIDPAPAEELFHDESTRDKRNPKSKGLLSVYIPAKMVDNKYLDEEYGGQFTALPEALADAYRDGDWDAVVGAALHTLSRERHQLRAFQPPRHWTRFMVIDWGTAAPFSVGWYCVSEGAELKAKGEYPARWIPSGALIRYDEYYGWNGKANQGCRKAAQLVAREIIAKEKERGDIMDYRIGDTEMWADRGARSIAEIMYDAEITFKMEKSKKGREHNYAEVLSRLAGNPRFQDDGTMEEDPMLFVTENCRHWWRTVPTLTIDETNPEKGPDTRSEDHCFDDTSYACRSRPFVTTRKDRYIEEWGDEIRHARTSGDPYSTA